ncbi:MAG: hypothetical protein ACTSYI_10485 [Promethearchaeota archaeon]
MRKVETKYGDIILILMDFKSLNPIGSIMKEMKHVIELYRLIQNLEEAKRRENYALALEIYNHIIVLKQKISNRFGVAKSMAEKANLLERMGFPQKALELYVGASKVIENTSNHDFSGIIFHRIAQLNSVVNENF